MCIVIEKKYYNEIKKENIERFIKNYYGEEFDFLKDEHVVSGVDCLYDVKKNDIDDLDKQRLDLFLLTGIYEGLTTVLLNHLCDKDQLSEGKYLIVT